MLAPATGGKIRFNNLSPLGERTDAEVEQRALGIARKHEAQRKKQMLGGTRPNYERVPQNYMHSAAAIMRKSARVLCLCNYTGWAALAQRL
jgi:hypothetical protein